MTLDRAGDLASATAASGYAAYRVVQEALTNARRYAPGRLVDVMVRAETERLRLRVATPYDAAGNPHTGGSGRGLSGMRERVEGLGGTLSAEVRDDAFVVEAQLPRGGADDPS